MNEPLSQFQLGVQVIIFFVLSAISLYFGRRFGIWKKKGPPSSSGSVWTIFFGVLSVIGSAFIVGFIFERYLDLKNFNELVKDPLYFSIFQCIYLLASLIYLGLLSYLNKLGLWKTSSPLLALKEFGFGMLSLIFIIPFVNLANSLIKLILTFFKVNILAKQDVLALLENTSKYPLACVLMLISIVVLVPLVEEILFRGLIQSWLRKKLGVALGLSLSVLVFTIAHFSMSHGLANI